MEYENFLKTFIQNVDYINKDIALTHILNFLKHTPQFEPREAVRQNAGSITSFIEMIGFSKQMLMLSKIRVQLLLDVHWGSFILPQIPTNISNSSRQEQYLLRNLDNIIIEEERLVRQKYIFFQQNQKKEDFIRLKFPIFQQWSYQKDSIYSLYVRLLEIINRPPLIQSKLASKISRESHFQKNQSSIKAKAVMNNKVANEMISKLESEMTQILISKQNLEEFIESENYSLARQLFLADHLIELKKKITSTRNLIIEQSNIIKARLDEVEKSNDCSSLFQISQGDEQKMQVIAEQQALKEMEVKLRSTIEKGEGKKFSDFKKAMKILYQKMFENQTKVLKLSK